MDNPATQGPVARWSSSAMIPLRRSGAMASDAGAKSRFYRLFLAGVVRVKNLLPLGAFAGLMGGFV